MRITKCRKSIGSGMFAGGTLASIQPTKSKLSKRLCRRHRWTTGKFTRRCSVCGLEQEMETTSRKWIES